MTESEKENQDESELITIIPPDKISLIANKKTPIPDNFPFDKIFNESTEIDEIFSTSSQQIIYNILQGFNGAIMCYGQTGMGKTYTINELVSEAVDDLYDQIEFAEDSNNLFKVEVGGFEISKEQINDLIDIINITLDLKENEHKRIVVNHLTYFNVNDSTELNDIISKILSKRNNESLSMKEYTSRSNCIIVINVYRYLRDKKQLKCGCLYLVDLEGSEKISKNKIDGESHEEEKILNKSLNTLHQIIQAISNIKHENVQTNFIPFRESKLTQILYDCFVGNCYTSLILNICQSNLYILETRNTLLFGQKVKNLKTHPKANIINRAENHPIVLEMLKYYEENLNKRGLNNNKCKKLIKNYEKQINALKKKIQELLYQISQYEKEIR